MKYCYESPVCVYPLNILVENAKCLFRTFFNKQLFFFFFLMYVLQTNISKLYYFVNVVLLIFYFLSYISKQNLCKQNLRIDQFYLTLFRMGRGQIQLPLPLLHSPRSFFSVRVTTLIFSDFNLHSLRNFWPIFENAASTQTLLHLDWEKKHECQKLPKNESNKYGRQEEGLIMLGIFFCAQKFYTILVY